MFSLKAFVSDVMTSARGREGRAALRKEVVEEEEVGEGIGCGKVIGAPCTKISLCVLIYDYIKRCVSDF